MKTDHISQPNEVKHTKNCMKNFFQNSCEKGGTNLNEPWKNV